MIRLPGKLCFATAILLLALPPLAQSFGEPPTESVQLDDEQLKSNLWMIEELRPEDGGLQAANELIAHFANAVVPVEVGEAAARASRNTFNRAMWQATATLVARSAMTLDAKEQILLDLVQRDPLDAGASVAFLEMYEGKTLEDLVRRISNDDGVPYQIRNAAIMRLRDQAAPGVILDDATVDSLHAAVAELTAISPVIVIDTLQAYGAEMPETTYHEETERYFQIVGTIWIVSSVLSIVAFLLLMSLLPEPDTDAASSSDRTAPSRTLWLVFSIAYLIIGVLVTLTIFGFGLRHSGGPSNAEATTAFLLPLPYLAIATAWGIAAIRDRRQYRRYND